MHKTSRLKQMTVYVKKNARLFMNQKDWKFIIIAAVISLLVCAIVGKNMFGEDGTYESAKSGFFAIISAAIWIGIFNSIQRVCKEHETIRSEYRSGLHISSYVFSHVVFDFALCFVQALILVIICNIFIEFPEDGIIFGNSLIEYFISLFLISSDSASFCASREFICSATMYRLSMDFSNTSNMRTRSLSFCPVT